MSVPSPCIGVCSLDENEVCVGCYRTVMEICDWSIMDDEAKRAVLVAVERRATGYHRLR